MQRQVNQKRQCFVAASLSRLAIQLNTQRTQGEYSQVAHSMILAKHPRMETLLETEKKHRAGILSKDTLSRCNNVQSSL
jgi:hypothetical protein